MVLDVTKTTRLIRDGEMGEAWTGVSKHQWCFSNVHRKHKAYLGRGEGGEGAVGGGGGRDYMDGWEKREIIYLSGYTLSPPELLPIKMGSDDSHFNVSLIQSLPVT